MENQDPQKFNLDEHTKVEIFAVPENYFEELPSRIQEKLHKKNSQVLNVFSSSALAIKISGAFSVILLVGFFYFNLNRNVDENINVTPSVAFTDQEILDFLLDNEIETNEILEEDKVFIDPQLGNEVFLDEEIMGQLDTYEIEELASEFKNNSEPK